MKPMLTRSAGRDLPTADSFSFEKLLQAMQRAARGKRRRRDVAAFLLNAPAEISKLHREIQDGSYRLSHPHVFCIQEPKPRVISALPFRDRVVQHALIAATASSIEPRMRSKSFACRLGFGTHRALALATRFARLRRFVLKVDIRKFFPSIDHAILRSILFRAVADPVCRWMTCIVLDGTSGVEPVAFHFPGDTLLTPIDRRHGLPIGNLTSQIWANLYLSSVDDLVCSKLGHRQWMRYCDDLFIFDDSAQKLRASLVSIKQSASELRLRVHGAKTHVQPTSEPFRCLGFVIQGKRVRIQRQAVRRFIRRTQVAFRAAQLGKQSWTSVGGGIAAWFAHAGYGQTRSLCKELRRTIPRLVKH
jgi:hypothetical protein